MNGILGSFPYGGALSPQQQGLAQMGLGMMAASGPSLQPTSLGQVVGQGGLMGMQAMRQAQNDQMRNALFGMQIQQMQAAQKKQEELAKLAGNFKNPKAKMLAGAGDLKGAINTEYPNFMDGFQKINPKDFTPESVAKFEESMKPSVLRVRGDPNALFDADGNLQPKVFQAQAALRQMGAPKTTVHLPPGESEWSKQLAILGAKSTGEAFKAADGAVTQNSRLEQVLSNTDGSFSGGAAGLIKNVSNMLASFGIPQELTAKLTKTELVDQAIAQMQADYMQQLGARGLTDEDMKVLRQALPKVNQSAQARKAVAALLIKANNATIESANKIFTGLESDKDISGQAKGSLAFFRQRPFRSYKPKDVSKYLSASQTPQTAEVDDETKKLLDKYAPQ